MKNLIKEMEELAEQMHIWYLEATKELHPESYNSNAQKSYAEMTEEQREIDCYIARKILGEYTEKIVEEILKSLPSYNKWSNNYEKNRAVEDNETGRNPVLREIRDLLSSLTDKEIK